MFRMAGFFLKHLAPCHDNPCIGRVLTPSRCRWLATNMNNTVSLLVIEGACHFLLSLCVIYGLWAHTKISGKVHCYQARKRHLYVLIWAPWSYVCVPVFIQKYCQWMYWFSIFATVNVLPQGRHFKFLLEWSLRTGWANLDKSRGSLSFCVSVTWLSWATVPRYGLWHHRWHIVWVWAMSETLHCRALIHELWK